MIISHVRADSQGSDSHFEPSVAFRFHLPNGNARLVNRVAAGWHAEYLRSRNLGESTSLDHSRWLSKPNDQSILLERRTRWNTPKTIREIRRSAGTGIVNPRYRNNKLFDWMASLPWADYRKRVIDLRQSSKAHWRASLPYRLTIRRLIV